MDALAMHKPRSCLILSTILVAHHYPPSSAARSTDPAFFADPRLIAKWWIRHALLALLIREQ
jgi:hypothetical protein